MTKNPYVAAGVESDRAVKASRLSRGTVSSALSLDGDSGAHHTVFGDTMRGGTKPRPLVVPVHGDAYAPPEGRDVLVGRTLDGMTALGSLYTTDSDVPDVAPGERVLSHPVSDARVRFNADGTLDIYGDPEIRLNDGQKRAITDVTLSTSTDADGHVTGVSLELTRSENVYL